MQTDPQKRLEYQRAWRARNLDHARAWARNYRAKNLAKKKKYELEQHRLHLRHWWPERFDLFLREQDGKCDICGIAMTPGRHGIGLCADHSHKTGHPRALLCSNCNKGLGHFKDDPVRLERAAAYLRRWGG